MKTLSKILMIALCSSFMSYAQVTNQLNPNFINQVPSVKECGTEATPQQILHMTQTREDRQDWEQPETFITIPVQHHIVRMNDGSGGLDPLEITGLMQDLNDYYVNSNMQFYECSGVNFINSTTNYNFNTTNTNSFCGANDVADVLNIYYFNSITSSSGSSLCGVSYFPPSSDRSLMKNSCALNGTTIVHEVGHYFSLYHSHGKTNCGTTDELVNGSNCATAGDDVCDTPADPNLQLSSTGSGCGSTTWVNNTTSCSYTGTFTDANGDSYSPDPTNIMSYSLKSCRTNLTAGQYNRANFSAVNDRNNLTCSSSNPDLSIGNGSFWNGFIWGGSPGTPPITINNNWIIYNQIQVVNDASGSGTIPSELGFYLSTNSTISTGDYFLGWNPVPSISPGDTSIQSAVFDIGSSYYNSIPNGTYYIGAYADYSNVVYETTASNNGEAFQYSNGIINPLTGTFIWNYYQITITRGCMDSLASNYNANANIDDGSCTYPDLEITNESHLVTICFPQPCTTSTPPVSINGSIIDFNVEVTNNGTGSASPTQLGYYLSLNANIVPNLVDHLLGTDQVDGGFTLIGVPLQILYFDLAVGNTSTETATFDLADTAFNNIPDGTYYIGAYADYDNTLYESNEYNNDAAFEYAFNPVMGYTNYQITILRGCTDSTAINYNAAATIDDGTCIPCIYGCTGPSFCNYDSTATCDDGSCFGMMGCTDAFASNYDAMATCDDGSCIPCTDNQVTIIINTGNWGYEMDWNLTNSSGVVVASNCCVLNYFSTTDSMEVVELCLPDDCYSMNMFDYYGDGWNGGTYEIWTTGPINSATMIASGTALNMNNVAGPAGSDNVQIGTTVSCAVLGCTDPTATNYDPNATVDDGSCIFSSIVISNPINGANFTTNNNVSVNYTVSNFAVGFSNAGIDGHIHYHLNGQTTMIFNTNAISLNGLSNGNYTMVVELVDNSHTSFNPLITDTVTFSVNLVYGCADPTATNYNPNATVNDGSCIYPLICSKPTPTGIFASEIIDVQARVNWDDMNTATCLVDQVRIQYREVGTTTWSQRNAVGSGLCVFGLGTTSKVVFNLTPATTYEYRIKSWYCNTTGSSTWSAIQTFTTLGACPNVINLAVNSPTTTKATFTWNTAGVYSFVRLKLRVDTTASTWLTAGGFGVNYPALTKNKNGLTPGTSYRASSRTWCDPAGGRYKASAWTPFIFWTQPVGARMENPNLIDRKLLRVTDVLGRKVNPKTIIDKSTLFYIYSDGTVEKRIIVD